MKAKKLIVILLAILAFCIVAAGVLWFAVSQKNAAEPKDTHVHNFATTMVLSETTCINDGMTVHVCECKAEKVEVFPAYGHSYDQWTVQTAATCQVAGLEQVVCKNCNEVQQREINPTQHNYALVTTEKEALVLEYSCSICADSFTIESSVEADLYNARHVSDCDKNYSFQIYCKQDEAYIRQHLYIADTYFHRTEKEVRLPYNIEAGYNSTWTISPIEPYTAGNIYIAVRSGDILFEDFTAQDMTFQIHKDDSKVIALSENVIFLQALEKENPGYYPYSIEYSESSETYWVSLQKVSGLHIGDIICVGNARSLTDIIQDDDEADFFGKIKAIHTDSAEDRFLVELESPDLTELFSELDVYSSDIIPLEDIQFTDSEILTMQATQMLYQSEDFAQFICATQDTALTYLSARGYTTNLSSLEDFFNSIHIDKEKSQEITCTDGVISGKIVLAGNLSIPITLSSDKDSEQLGDISIYFEASVSLDSMEILLQLEKQKVQIDGVEQIIKSQIGTKQQLTIGFTIGAKLNMDWSLGAKPYVLNTKTGKYHFKTCKHVAAVKDTTVLSKMSAETLFGKIADESIQLDHECKTCLPISSMMADSYILNTSSKTIHLHNCSHVKGKNISNIEVSELPYGNLLAKGYSGCDDCSPDSRYTNSFSEQVLNTMQYKDLGNNMDEFKELAKQISDENPATELEIAKIPFSITGVDRITLRLCVYFDFTLDATVEYRNEYQINSEFGIYVTDSGFDPYAYSTKQANENRITMTGKARVDLGLLAGIKVYVVGLEKFCYADLSAKVGLYAKVQGALQHDFLNENNNYAAAYFEAGLHCDLLGSIRLAFWKSLDNSFIPEHMQDKPFLSYGFEKVYYNFDKMPDEITLDTIYYNLDDADLLNVKYYNIVKMESGTDKLNITGITDKYTVEFLLADGSHCAVSDGYLLVNTPYESFTDELTIRVTGYDTWGKYRQGNTQYTIHDYTIKITYDASLVNPEDSTRPETIKTVEIPDDAQIPEDVFEYNGHYYKLYSDTCDSWEDAKQYCEDKGGYLAVISSAEENEALYQYMKDCGQQNAYFGLYQPKDGGRWVWANGELNTYVNWASGEPNNESKENYAEFYYKYSDGKWNDGNFGGGTQNDTKVFLCEWGDYTVGIEEDDQTEAERLDSIVGYYQGWYTAPQGITGGAVGVHRTNGLLKDEKALQMYADLATECAKDSSGAVTKVFTIEDIRSIVSNHTEEYIVIYMYGPLRENPTVEDGLYTMRIEYNESTGLYELYGDQWIYHDNYVFAEIKITLNNDLLLGDIYGETGFLFTEYADLGDLSMVRYTPSFE